VALSPGAAVLCSTRASVRRGGGALRLQTEHTAQLSPDAVLIKLGDKISNVLDVTHSPPTKWNIERRREYLDWAEAVVNNCPRVNSALEAYFAQVIGDGRRKLFPS
jgi:hypothetical protein